MPVGGFSVEADQASRVLVDVNRRRRQVIALNRLANADSVYKLYYDETNNIRRLHIRDNGLNVREPKCFVVGGVACAAGRRGIELGSLRLALRIQHSAPEIKLKHVATGDFLEIIGAPRLETYLQWLIEEGLHVHYSVVDPLYWSIVDIVDSILAEFGDTRLMSAHFSLKNDLYSVLRQHYDGTVDIFQRYSYPDVGRVRRRAFMAELIDLMEHGSDLLEHFNYMMLKGVLEIGLKLDSLPFLEDETPNVLIDGFGAFFQERICVLKNAVHILDVEEVIKDYLARLKFLDGDQELKNFRFAASHEEPGIQVSDVIIGVLGKYFSFICATSDEDLSHARAALDPQQCRNLGLLNELLERSLSENPVFAHCVMSVRDRAQGEFFRALIR
ncbi:DUF3800 domain-containing protein [Ensifer sp. P24N7]|uniref:DUF3800 domain-containing protein n=1 Tax=Sinorhizobium sp. P24N7 TaxID=3348358 RepID=UPI0035F48D5C